MAAPVPVGAFPERDEDVAAFARDLGLEGLLDVHVHLLPEGLQQAVWAFFDRLDDPPWPIAYRQGETARLSTLQRLGVRAHTALAYAHKPGVAAACNAHTLAAAERHAQVIPTFTLYPEDGVDAEVAAALDRGGRIAKVHLQVGRFHATDPRLDGAWRQLAAARVPALIHATAVYGVDGGAEYCGPDAIRALLERHPDLTVIVAHLGMPDLEGFLALADEVDSLRFDTAMVCTDPPFLGELTDAQAEAVAARADRLLFGSDFPSIPHRYAGQVRGLARLGLDRDALRGVLHDHAAALLGLPPAA